VDKHSQLTATNTHLEESMCHGETRGNGALMFDDYAMIAATLPLQELPICRLNDITVLVTYNDVSYTTPLNTPAAVRSGPYRIIVGDCVSTRARRIGMTSRK
jgi:hypothetical protein